MKKDISIMSAFGHLIAFAQLLSHASCSVILTDKNVLKNVKVCTTRV